MDGIPARSWLHIARAAVSDSGNYSCTAGDTVMAKVRVHVLDGELGHEPRCSLPTRSTHTPATLLSPLPSLLRLLPLFYPLPSLLRSLPLFSPLPPLHLTLPFHLPSLPSLPFPSLILSLKTTPSFLFPSRNSSLYTPLHSTLPFHSPSFSSHPIP